MSEDTGHGWAHGGAEVKFIEAEKTAMGVEDSVVMHHSCHKPAGECMAVDKGYGRHGESVRGKGFVSLDGKKRFKT